MMSNESNDIITIAILSLDIIIYYLGYINDIITILLHYILCSYDYCHLYHLYIWSLPDRLPASSAARLKGAAPSLLRSSR